MRLRAPMGMRTCWSFPVAPRQPSVFILQAGGSLVRGRGSGVVWMLVDCSFVVVTKNKEEKSHSITPKEKFENTQRELLFFLCAV